MQVFCGGGMDNPVEIDFWDTGEVIGTVNLFHGTPRGDCLVHWVWGGVYPRTDQQDCIAEFPRTVGLLDEIVNYGHVAVSGMCRYRGDQFGKGWDQSVFITLFNTHKVIRTTLERSGSTFKATATEDFVVFDDPDSHPTDVLEDADGSLLVIDTGGWFRIGCPASQVAKPQIGGAIYRVRKEGSHRVRDPRGDEIAFDRISFDQLLDLQADLRPVVVAKAFSELRKRDAKGHLGSSTLDDSQNRHLVSLVIRGIAKPDIFLSGKAFDAAIESCQSADLAERRRAIEYLVRQISIPNARKFSPLPINFAFLRAIQTEPVDRVLEHVVTHALMQDQSYHGASVTSSKEWNPKVQRALLIAADHLDVLRGPTNRLQRDQVVALLSTTDADLQREVFDVISRREGWAAGVVNLISQWLSESSLSDDRRAIIRRFLAARSAEPSVRKLIADQFARPDLPEAIRQTLLEVLVEANLTQWPANGRAVWAIH